MFGYVLPPLGTLPQEERRRFQEVYCGLCHTLGRRYGPAARMILNYDFAFLTILLSGPEEGSCESKRCVASPFRCRRCLEESAALELAADESVILAYRQLRDGVADHGFWKGLKYRLFSALLWPAFQKAARLRPEFNNLTARQLERLAQLEEAHSPSLDEAADTFAELLAGAADTVLPEARRRVLRQMLYHLGRWIYLIDAADDLEEDFASGNYNPLILRYRLTAGALEPESRQAFTETVDQSVRMIATAFELWDFGSWSKLLESTIYAGLFQVGKSVLDGTFETGIFGKKTEKNKNVEESA